MFSQFDLLVGFIAGIGGTILISIIVWDVYQEYFNGN